MLCKTYIFIKSILLSYKNWKLNYKIFNKALILLLWVKVIFFDKENSNFLPKNADISKVKRVLVLKGMFSEPACVRVPTPQILPPPPSHHKKNP